MKAVTVMTIIVGILFWPELTISAQFPLGHWISQVALVHSMFPLNTWQSANQPNRIVYAVPYFSITSYLIIDTSLRARAVFNGFDRDAHDLISIYRMSGHFS